MSDTNTETYRTSTTRTVLDDTPRSTVLMEATPTTEEPRKNSLMLLIIVSLFAVMAVWLVASLAGNDDKMIVDTEPAPVVTSSGAANAPATLPSGEKQPVVESRSNDDGSTTVTTAVPVTNPAD